MEQTVAAPIDDLFEVLSDHAAYERFDEIKGSELIQVGEQDRNGVGAVRRVKFPGGIMIEEEILTFERPRIFEYRIIKSRPLPFNHEIGRVELEPAGEDRTKVTWTSILEVPVPVIGGFATRRTVKQLNNDFRSIIGAAAEVARRGTASPAAPAG